MTTPIALKLAADEEVGFKEIVTTPRILNKILKQKHVDVTPEILKQLPRAMADPILVFKSATVPGSYVSMLELKDDKGGTVVVPVALNSAEPGKQAFMTSIYGKGNITQANDQWFAEQVESGNLRYMNTKKSTSWARDVGHQLPIMSRQPEALRELNIPTEADLVKARFENPGVYQDERQQAPRGAYEAANRIIRLFESADASTLLHETGHAFLDDFARFIKSGKADIQVQADWSALMEWLGSDGKSPLTREQHEQFARGFEAYLLEGRAPSLGLRNVFEQFKNWLIGIYRGVEGLNVTLSDEVRGVRGRLAERAGVLRDRACRPYRGPQDAGLYEDYNNARSGDRAFLAHTPPVAP